MKTSLLKTNQILWEKKLRELSETLRLEKIYEDFECKSFGDMKRHATESLVTDL